MKAILSVLLAALVTGCSANEVLEYVKPSDVGMVTVPSSSNTSAWANDRVTIDSASIRQHQLYVFLSYGGGCNDHEFAAIAAGPWLESHPVQLGVYIAHEGHGDPCRALLRSVLRFDLAEVRAAYLRNYQQNSGEIILRLSALSEPGRVQATARYTF
jgi:hypothetical protein